MSDADRNGVHPEDELEVINPARTARQALRILSLLLRLLFAAFIIASLTLSALTLNRMAGQSDRLVEISQSNEDLNRLMLDCTQPGGQCFKASQERTGEAVFTLNAVTKAAVVCADQSGVITHKEMESCIQRQLGK